MDQMSQVSPISDKAKACRPTGIAKAASCPPVRHSFATHLLGNGLRHSDAAGVAGAQGCEHDDNLHAWRSTIEREKPAGLMGAPSQPHKDSAVLRFARLHGRRSDQRRLCTPPTANSPRRLNCSAGYDNSNFPSCLRTRLKSRRKHASCFPLTAPTGLMVLLLHSLRVVERAVSQPQVLREKVRRSSERQCFQLQQSLRVQRN